MILILIAKIYQLKIELEVHATTIKVIQELIKDPEVIKLINKGYQEFQNLARELSDAKKDRVKVQYYTGTGFMLEKYQRRAKEFYEEVVLPYIEKVKKLMDEK